jgi:hypothetical protein
MIPAFFFRRVMVEDVFDNPSSSSRLTTEKTGNHNR